MSADEPEGHGRWPVDADRSRADPVLRLRGLTKRFGGTAALSDVTFDLHQGEILALLGENGAGKSTLIKCLAGIHVPDAGEIRWRGKAAPKSARARPAVAFIHQDLGLIEWMTVTENVCLTLGYPRRRGMIDWPAAEARARHALALLGVDIDPDTRVNRLSRTERSMVAIARALTAEAQILVLDEPTASLPTGEAERLFVVLRRLRERGIAMIYVSHRLDEIFAITDRIIVLRDGRLAGERGTGATSLEELITLIVGREPAQVFRRPAHREGTARVQLEAVTSGPVGPISLTVHSREIVGLVGLRGAGQEAVGRLLFGLAPESSGQIRLDGTVVAPRSPEQAMRMGINLICGDRGTESVFGGRTVAENMFPNQIMAGIPPIAWLSPGREARRAVALGAMVGLRPNAPDLAIESLSGGNQQKVVVGRWLNNGGKVFVFEDPTAGVDVGAKAEIYRLFDIVLQEGAAILIVSGDFEEVAKICHRALVFDRGRVVAELDERSLSIDALIAAASAGVAA
jgi:ribose transport system ATP-binding protein